MADEFSLPSTSEGNLSVEGLQTLLDDLAIRNLTASFTDTVIRHDHDGFRALWMPDALWEIKDPLPASVQGAGKIVAMLSGLLEVFEFFVQMTHRGVVSVQGDQATARWVVQVIGRGKDGKRCYNN